MTTRFVAGVDSTPEAPIRARLQQLIAVDPNIAVLSALIGPRGMLEWAHSVGVATDEILANCVAPIPPLELRQIVADPNVAPFLYSGFLDASVAASMFQEYGGTDHVRPTVLDFGCGCGRVMRFFDPQTWEVRGAEINPAHVRWCNENLAGTRTVLNNHEPPVPIGDSTVDFAYALSVFSHLPRALDTAWLADLARIIRPGGLAVISTHGYAALATIAASREHQEMFRLTAAEAVAIGDRLAADELVHLPYAQDVLDLAQAGPSYGNTFVDPGYAERTWGRDNFALTAHLPGGLRGWQDVYVLTRR